MRDGRRSNGLHLARTDDFCLHTQGLLESVGKTIIDLVC